MSRHSLFQISYARPLFISLRRGRLTGRVLVEWWGVLFGIFAIACSVRAADWGDAVVDIVELETGVKASPEKTVWSATQNGCRVARAEFDENARWRVRLDGKPIASYNAILRMHFSPDGSAFAYMARRGFERFYVINGAEGRVSEELYSFAFSSDGKHHGYLAKMEGGMRMIVDGLAHPASDGMSLWKTAPVFSADGSKVAWIEATPGFVQHREGHRMRMVINGKPDPLFGGCGLQRVFSSDGSKLAYAVFEKSKAFFMVDGERHPAFDAVGVDFVFSPDAKRSAYFASDKDGRVLVMDGKVEARVEGNLDHMVTFSPDSKRLLYGVLKPDGSCYLVVDGKKGPVYESMGAPAVPAGLEVEPTVSALFSPDSKRIAYLAKKDSRFLIVVDGVEGTVRFDGVVGAFGVDRAGVIHKPLRRAGLIFSPDSKRVAFVADGKTGFKQFVIVDDKKHQEYPGVTRPSFSPDSKHLAYAAFAEDRTRMLVVVDGVEREGYDAVVAPPVYTKAGFLEFIALNEGKLLKVRVRDAP